MWLSFPFVCWTYMSPYIHPINSSHDFIKLSKISPQPPVIHTKTTTSLWTPRLFIAAFPSMRFVLHSMKYFEGVNQCIHYLHFFQNWSKVLWIHLLSVPWISPVPLLANFFGLCCWWKGWTLLSWHAGWCMEVWDRQGSSFLQMGRNREAEQMQWCTYSERDLCESGFQCLPGICLDRWPFIQAETRHRGHKLACTFNHVLHVSVHSTARLSQGTCVSDAWKSWRKNSAILVVCQ